MPDVIEFKGIREGVLATIDSSVEWPNILAELTSRIDAQSSFFHGANIVLQLDARVLQRSELARLIALLHARQVQVASVLSSSAATQSAARQLGIAIDLAEIPSATTSPSRNSVIESTSPAYPEKMFGDEIKGNAAVLIRRTLRSGSIVQHEGHVVVLGDVNPGAEIIAGGDVIVWGHLRGVVHAGAMGDDGAVICALNLQPTQLRISGLISVSPPGRWRKSRPEKAYIEDGQIRAEAWKS